MARIERWRAVLLAEFVAVGIESHRQVRIARRRQAEHSLQVDLARRRVEQIAAAHHLGDALLGVVDDDRQLVGEQAISAVDDKIPDITRQALVMAALNRIFEADQAVISAQADG